MSISKINAGVELEIPFYDLDPMQVVWHGNYIKYFERARCELLRLLDYDYPQMEQSGYLWPIVELRVKYVKPAIFGNIVVCSATLEEYENRLKISYEIRDKKGNTRLTKGYSIQVAVAQSNNEMQLVSPEFIRRRIREYHENL